MDNPIRTVAWLAVAALLSLVLWDLHSLIRDERQTFATTLRDLHVTILEAGLTLKNLREASETWKKASQEQADNSTKATARVSAAAEQLSLFVSNTDRSVNASLLPAMTQAISQQNAALLASQEALQENLKAMLLATQQLQKTLADADTRISDPAIQKSIDNLAAATQQATLAMTNVAGITKDGKDVADKFRNDYMHPSRFAWQLIKELVGLGGSAAQIVK
jgi:hypothetical protein